MADASSKPVVSVIALLFIIMISDVYQFTIRIALATPSVPITTSASTTLLVREGDDMPRAEAGRFMRITSMAPEQLSASQYIRFRKSGGRAFCADSVDTGSDRGTVVLRRAWGAVFFVELGLAVSVLAGL